MSVSLVKEYVPTDENIDEFIDGYACTHLWANVESVEYGADGEPLTDEYGEAIRNEDASVIAEHGGGLHTFDSASQDAIRKVCRDFVASNAADLLAVAALPEYYRKYSGHDWTELGQCFALNSAGHGTGYWDGGFGEAGDRLSDASRVYGDTGGWLDADGVAHYGY